MANTPKKFSLAFKQINEFLKSNPLAADANFAPAKTFFSSCPFESFRVLEGAQRAGTAVSTGGDWTRSCRPRQSGGAFTPKWPQCGTRTVAVASPEDSGTDKLEGDALDSGPMEIGGILLYAVKGRMVAAPTKTRDRFFRE